MNIDPFRKVVVVVVATFLLGALSHPVGAATPDEQRLFERVIKMLSAQRKAITSVQCEYTDTSNSIHRKVRYFRAGERFYHASTGVQGETGWSVPCEVAWDGQQGSSRTRFNLISFTRNREDIHSGCPVPEDDACTDEIKTALGFTDRGNGACKFRAAREVVIDGNRKCIELTFDMPSYPGTLTVIHDPHNGYWPVREQLRSASNELHFETDIEYTRRDINGNRLFYPVRISQRATVPGRGGSLVLVEVDERTLRLNEPIPDSRFVMEPWPSESVWYRDTSRSSGPKDRTWSPRGKVGFPWDIVAVTHDDFNRLSEAEKRAAGSAVAAVDEKAAGTTESTSHRREASIAQPTSNDSDLTWIWIVAVGATAASAALLWMLIKR